MYTCVIHYKDDTLYIVLIPIGWQVYMHTRVHNVYSNRPRLSLSTMVSIQFRYGTCPLLVEGLLRGLTPWSDEDECLLDKPFRLEFSLPWLVIYDRFCKLSLLGLSELPVPSLGGVEEPVDAVPFLLYCWSVTITCSRWCSERLMCLASWRMRPSAPVFATRSEPARSTRLSLDLYRVNNTHRQLGYVQNILVEASLCYEYRYYRGLRSVFAKPRATQCGCVRE